MTLQLQNDKCWRREKETYLRYLKGEKRLIWKLNKFIVISVTKQILLSKYENINTICAYKSALL